MTAPTDALRALDPSYWEVEVRVSGVRVLTIGSDHLAGISNIEDYADTVRKCGEHLLSFVGDGMCYCQEGVTCPTCERSEVAALQAEVAQLQAALAEARRDAERLDWAHDYAHALSWNHDGERIVIRGEDGAEFTGESWRECIDAALHQRKENGHGA